ncbi:MAG: acetylglutamate kinase [Verrucomicrobiota bacterium]
MDQVIQKAAVLIEALPYIQRFGGDIVVVKFGGSIMEDPEGIDRILTDIVFMNCIGLKPVIVHGGGKDISRAMQEEGLEPHFLQGLRVTDQASIRVVERVLNHSVNPDLVSRLKALECRARGIHGEDILTAEKHTETDPESGETLDWEFVGNVVQVDTEPILAYLQAGIIPVITPLGRDTEQHIYNCNADVAAAAVARELGARKLVFLSDVPGLLRDPEDPGTLISTVNVSEVPSLIEQGVIGGGMLPKINGGVKAIQAGVRKTHLIDAGMPHSLLLELFTDEGVGTEIIHD